MLPEVIFGLLLAATVVEAAARFVLWQHDRGFVTSKGSSKHSRSTGSQSQSGGTEVDTARAEWLELHERAKSSQRSYLLWTARTVSLMAVALLVLFISLVLFNSPPSWLKLLAVLLDTAAFALVLYWRGRALREQLIWIVSRVGSELIRHSRHLKTIVTQDDVEPLISLIQRVATEVLFQRGALDCTNLSEELERLQNLRVSRNQCAIGQAKAFLTSQQWHNYVDAWPKEQQRWFVKSYQRLDLQRHSRERWLMRLFWFGVVVAVVKMGTLWIDYDPNWGAVSLASIASFAMVSVTTFTASLVAYTANRNSRSLLHLYALQQMRLKDWLSRAALPANFFAGNDLPLPEDLATRLSILAIELDKIMFEELRAWLHTTGLDSIELAA